MQNRSNEQRLTDAILWLANHQQQQPSLTELADQMGLSPSHAQRCFQQGVGVSPKKFLQFLTREAALERLTAGASVMEAALDSGLSGPGRLHDLMVTTCALSPGEARRRGKGLTFEHGRGESPFGPAQVAWTRRGVAFLGFEAIAGPDHAVNTLYRSWPAAQFSRDDDEANRWLDRIFSGAQDEALPIWLHGSPFQLKVWEALLGIPTGLHTTYGHLAAVIGQPGAARAVGAAIGQNPVAWLIPCHRVIGQLGEMTGYRWGVPVKQAMIAREVIQAQGQAQIRDQRSEAIR